MKQTNPARRAIAELLGSTLLLAAIIGSGVMGERLANSIAVGAALVALILTFGDISGAHFNPAVTVSDAMLGGIKWREVPVYIVAQTVGAFVGVGLANLMFDLPVFFAAHKIRSGGSQFLSEFVATFGLLAVIWGCVRHRSNVIAFAFAACIVAAFWFTASTSFANPAVTLARTASDTFAGIRSADAPAFIVAQMLGAIAATALFRWLAPITEADAENVIAAHSAE